MWANGVIQVHTNLDIGNNVTLEGVRIQLGPAFNLITTTNYQVEEHAGVYPNSLGLTAADMFSNSSSVVLSPAYDVLWNNGLPPVTQPELFIARDGTNVTLTWGDGSFSLQSNTNVVSPTGWVDVPGTSPVQQPIGTQPAFFRLKK